MPSGLSHAYSTTEQLPFQRSSVCHRDTGTRDGGQGDRPRASASGVSAGPGKGWVPRRSGRACTLRSMASSSVRRFARFFSSKARLTEACGRRRSGRCRARARARLARSRCSRCTGVALGERFDAGCAHRAPPCPSYPAPPPRASPWLSASWLPRQPATRRRGSMTGGAVWWQWMQGWEARCGRAPSCERSPSPFYPAPSARRATSCSPSRLG